MRKALDDEGVKLGRGVTKLVAKPAKKKAG